MNASMNPEDAKMLGNFLTRWNDCVHMEEDCKSKFISAAITSNVCALILQCLM